MHNRLDRPRVHGYDRVTLIVRGDALPARIAPARLPRERDRHTVVVAADPPLDLATLAGLLARHLPVRCESIRLVLSEAGRPDIAQVLADELRIEVLAPTGPVTLLPAGMLFVAGGEWSSFRPGEPAEPQGARHPAPDWQRLLPTRPRVLPAGLRTTPVPAGWWLHDAQAPAPELDPAVLSVFVDPERLTILVGRPGAEPLPPEPVYAVLESLPRAVRRRLVLVPYGAESSTSDTVGEWLAARTGGTVDVVSGVSHADPDGATVRTVTDAGGRRGWRPFVQRLVYRAGAAPQVVEWRRPLPGLDGTAGVQRVDGHWEIEVVRCGLWLRPGGTDPEQDLVRRLPVDARHPLLVLGDAAVSRAAEALAVLDTVVAGLPVDTVAALRLAVTRPPAQRDAALWAAVTARYGPPLAVVGPGHLVELPDRVPEPEDPSPADPSPADPSPADPASAVQPEPEPEPYLGVVFADWRPGTALFWRPGQVLVTAEPLAASPVPSPAPTVAPMLAVWSVTGRRVAGASPDRAEHVLFRPASRLRVLDVEHLGQPEPALVLLRDATADPATATATATAELDRRARVALRRAVDAVRRSPETPLWPVSPDPGSRASR